MPITLKIENVLYLCIYTIGFPFQWVLVGTCLFAPCKENVRVAIRYSYICRAIKCGMMTFRSPHANIWSIDAHVCVNWSPTQHEVTILSVTLQWYKEPHANVWDIHKQEQYIRMYQLKSYTCNMNSLYCGWGAENCIDSKLHDCGTLRALDIAKTAQS